MPLGKIDGNSAPPPYMSEPTLTTNATELSDLGEPINGGNLLEVAENLIKKEEPQKAVLVFDAILKRETTSISDQIQALLGRAKTLLKNPYIAHQAVPEEDLKRALALLEKDETDYHKILIAEIRRYLAIIYVRRNDPEAEECFKLGLKACLHEPLAAGYVQYLKNNKNYEGALGICRDVLKVNPNSPDFLYESAKINMILERWQEALESMRRFTYRRELKPADEREGLDAIVTCYFQMGNLGDAIPHLHKVMTFKDLNPVARAERSKKLLEAKLSQLPRELFGSIIGRILDHPDQYLQEGAFELFDLLANFKWNAIDRCKVLYLRASFCILLKKREHFESAGRNLKEAREAAKICKDHWPHAEALIDCREGRLSVLENKLEEARASFKKAMQQEKGTDCFDTFACFLRDDQKDYEALLEECDAFLKRHDLVRTQFFRGEALFYLHRWDEALVSYDTYLRHYSRLTAYDHAAIAAEKKGQPQVSYKYRLGAYADDCGPHLVDRHKQLLQMHKNILLVTGELNRQQIELPSLSRFIKAIEVCLDAEKPQETLQLLTYLFEQKLEADMRKEAISLHAKAVKKIDQQNKSKGAEKQTRFEELVYEELKVKKANEIVPQVKHLLKTREEKITVQHLEALCDLKQEDISYLIAVLEALNKPFSQHPKQYVKLLKLCAEKWKEKKGVEYGRAIRCYKLILGVMTAHPGVFNEGAKKEIEQTIIKVENEFSKYRAPYIQQVRERAACHENVGRFSAAIDLYEELLTIDMGEQERVEIQVLLDYAKEKLPLQLQRQVEVLFWRAKEFHEKGQLDKAIQNYREILRIGDDPKVLLPADRTRIEEILQELEKPLLEEKKE